MFYTNEKTTHSIEKKSSLEVVMPQVYCVSKCSFTETMITIVTLHGHQRVQR